MIPKCVGLQKLLCYYLFTNGHYRAGLGSASLSNRRKRDVYGRWKIVVFVASIRPQGVFSTHRFCLKRNFLYDLYIYRPCQKHHVEK